MSNFKEDFVIKYFTYEESYNHVGTTGHSYNRNGKYYVGTKIYDNGDTSAPYWTRTYYRGTTVGATGPADYIAAAETIILPTIKITVGTVYGAESVRINVGLCSSLPDNTQNETLHNRTATTLETITTSGNETISITGLTRDQVDKILRYGFVLSEASTSVNAYAEIISLLFETTFISKDALPNVKFAEHTGEYDGWRIYTDGATAVRQGKIEEPLTIKLVYSQEAGVANAGYKVVYETARKTETDEMETVDPVTVFEAQLPNDNGEITIPPQYWRSLTRAWDQENGEWEYARLTISAKSAVGKESVAIRLYAYNQLQVMAAVSPDADSIQITNNATTITWKRVIDENYNWYSEPSSISILYSKDDGATWMTLVDELAGSATSYTIPAGTMTSGSFMWRIVPKYVNDTLSAPTQNRQATSRFVYRTNPTTSSVSCDGKPQPTVSWTSSEQKSYQVRFGDYDSGAVYSSAKSHTIPRFFADGNYPVQVRTQVASGEWSDWSETIYVAITNTPPDDAVTLTAERDGDAVKLVWYCMYNATYVQYIVYRNGIPIHKTDGGKNMAGFVDNLAVGKSAYFVRGITATKNYYQSETKTVDATPATDLLYDVDAGTYIRLRYTVSSPTTVTYSRQIGVSYQYFAGRTEPVAIVNGRIERSTTQTYGSRTRELADKIDAMTGRTVLFRDTRGGGIYGVIEQVQTVHGRIHSVTFTVREVYHNERVEYTVPGS